MVKQWVTHSILMDGWWPPGWDRKKIYVCVHVCVCWNAESDLNSLGGAWWSHCWYPCISLILSQGHTYAHTLMCVFYCAQVSAAGIKQFSIVITFHFLFVSLFMSSHQLLPPFCLLALTFPNLYLISSQLATFWIIAFDVYTSLLKPPSMAHFSVFMFPHPFFFLMTFILIWCCIQTR